MPPIFIPVCLPRLTVFPPSEHESGEVVEWSSEGEPKRIDADPLLAQVHVLGAAALLAAHWPEKSGRHDAAMALAGGLLRAKWLPNDVEEFIEAVATAAGDEEVDDRVASIRKQQDASSRILASTLEVGGWWIRLGGNNLIIQE